MPAFQIIGALANVSNNAAGTVVPSGLLVALPAGAVAGGGDFILTNLSLSEDVFFEPGISTTTCTVPLGGDPGTPLLARTQIALKIAPGQTHIYFICAANSAVIVITPGMGE